MIKKELIKIAVDQLVPYERNPRKIPQEAIDDVRESYKQCGVIDPIEIDEENVILSGHTRRLAAIAEGIKEVDALRVTGLTKKQKKKYRLLANKTGEKSSWDYELLDLELEDLDFEGYDFGFDIYDEEPEPPEMEMGEKYTMDVNIPHYTPEGECPTFDEMVDVEKYEQLLERIDQSDVKEDVKRFLRLAAARHIGFNYKKIANYYAHQKGKIQRLMEESALVIIDVDDAIKNGYAQLKQIVDEMTEEEINAE